MIDANSCEIGAELRLVSTQRLNYPHEERLSGPEAESGAMTPVSVAALDREERRVA